MDDYRRERIRDSLFMLDSLRSSVQHFMEIERDIKFVGNLDYTEDAKISDAAYKNLCLALEHLDLAKHHLEEARKK